MQAEPTNQRGGSLANKHMKRKSANRLDGTKCPNDALRCGTHLLRFRATSPRPCPPKDSDQLEFRENCENYIES